MGLTNLASAGGGALARLIGPVIDFFNGQAVDWVFDNAGHLFRLFHRGFSADLEDQSR
jgi:hypothetical protein